MFELLRTRPIFLFDQTEGGGNAQTDTSAGTEDEAKAKADAESKAKKTGEDAKEKKKAVEWTPEQQAEIDRIMGETRKEERKKAKAESEKETEKAKKDAEDKALEEKQEFKTLADKRGTEIESLKAQVAELTTAKEQGANYKAALEGHLKTQIEKLSKPYQALIAKLDPLEQIKFLTDHARELGVKDAAGIDETPEGDATKLSKEQQERGRKQAALHIHKTF